MWIFKIRVILKKGYFLRILLMYVFKTCREMLPNVLISILWKNGINRIISIKDIDKRIRGRKKLGPVYKHICSNNVIEIEFKNKLGIIEGLLTAVKVLAFQIKVKFYTWSIHLKVEKSIYIWLFVYFFKFQLHYFFEGMYKQ